MICIVMPDSWQDAAPIIDVFKIYYIKYTSCLHTFPDQTREKWFLLIDSDDGKFLTAFTFVPKLRDYTGMQKQLLSKMYVLLKKTSNSYQWNDIEETHWLTYSDKESQVICWQQSFTHCCVILDQGTTGRVTTPHSYHKCALKQ